LAHGYSEQVWISPGGVALNRTVNFGVVGGYGATGKAVVSELLKSGDGEVLLGGRDELKSKAAAAEFGSRKPIRVGGRRREPEIAAIRYYLAFFVLSFSHGSVYRSDYRKQG
jgi:saccharopine dehydrogenase-like NADP-dependent oxidoreductase